MPPQPPRGGPRQRVLPTPRGVNMIVWSLDNRFVLAAIMGMLLVGINVFLQSYFCTFLLSKLFCTWFPWSWPTCVCFTILQYGGCYSTKVFGSWSLLLKIVFQENIILHPAPISLCIMEALIFRSLMLISYYSLPRLGSIRLFGAAWFLFHVADCRICVWNAAYGSLVHSLTGHTESVRYLSLSLSLALCLV